MTPPPEMRMPTKSNGELPPAPLARALIRSLTRGTAIAHGVRYIHVGHEKWLTAQQELLREVAEDGHSETKFVRGTYGAGKSHFLSVVQDRARDQGWMTSHIECKSDRVQIDRFETLYPSIVAKLLSTDILTTRAAMTEGETLDSVRFLLERWTRQQLRRAGVKDDGINRPFDADNRIYSQLQKGLLQSSLSTEFTRALAGFARASLTDDFDTTSAICRWLRGAEERVHIPAAYLQKPVSATPDRTATVQLRPIGKGTAHDVMRGLLWLIRSAGYEGLVLCIDEVEEIAKLGTRKRQDQALQALREYVDHAGGEGGYMNLCMYLAATPEMFEGENYFPRYDALATRIQALSPELNWRAPVIDLDRTPLTSPQMREMAMRIWDAHRAAYGQLETQEFTPDFVKRLVEGLVNTRFRIAKPRLLARVLVDELERARQRSSAYATPSDIDHLVVQAASQLTKESE